MSNNKNYWLKNLSKKRLARKILNTSEIFFKNKENEEFGHETFVIKYSYVPTVNVYLEKIFIRTKDGLEIFEQHVGRQIASGELLEIDFSNTFFHIGDTVYLMKDVLIED